MGESEECSASSSCTEDKRHTIRYSITGAVWFQWQGSDGQWHDAFGVTRNIGKTGVFVESDSIPPVGSPLPLTVILPSESNPNMTLRLGGTGSVRHVRQERSQTIGFGASVVFRVEVQESTGSAGR